MRFDIETFLVQKFSPHITPSTESRCGPSSMEDFQGSTPIIQEWKAVHDFLQTYIQASCEVEDACGW
jgi:hypothetical protein